MSKPLLLLDVDGVLCPFGVSEPHDLIREDFLDAQDEVMPVWHSREITDRVYRLMDTFEIHWCTGWGDDANKYISPVLGLPEFPVCPIPTMSLSIHWKFKAIQAYVKGRPYAFVDDDISREAVELMKQSEIPCLWVPVRCSVGLTEPHIDALEEWAENLYAMDRNST